MKSILFAAPFLLLAPHATVWGHEITRDGVEQLPVEAAIQEVRRTAAAYAAAESSEISIELAEAVLQDAVLWPSPYKVVTCFWNGSDDLRAAVVTIGSAWNAPSAASFDFGPAPHFNDCSAITGDVRISLDSTTPGIYDSLPQGAKRGGYWSQLGTLSRDDPAKISLNLPSINAHYLVWKVSPTSNPGKAFIFYTLHELGHAMGFSHEFQKTGCEGWFNKAAFMQQFGWTEEQFQTNFQLLPESEAIIYPERKPDKDSQMNYNLDPSLYVADQPGMPNPCRPNHFIAGLSVGDEDGLRHVYGDPVRVIASVDPSGPVVAANVAMAPGVAASGLRARSPGTAAQELDRYVQMRSVESSLALTQLRSAQDSIAMVLRDRPGANALSVLIDGPAARAMVAEGPFGPNLQASVPWQRLEMSPQVVEAPPAFTTLPEVISELSVKQEKLEEFSRAVENFQALVKAHRPQ